MTLHYHASLSTHSCIFLYDYSRQSNMRSELLFISDEPTIIFLVRIRISWTSVQCSEPLLYWVGPLSLAKNRTYCYRERIGLYLQVKHKVNHHLLTWVNFWVLRSGCQCCRCYHIFSLRTETDPFPKTCYFISNISPCVKYVNPLKTKRICVI